jgi:hypothetical protein
VSKKVLDVDFFRLPCHPSQLSRFADMFMLSGQHSQLRNQEDLTRQATQVCGGHSLKTNDALMMTVQISFSPVLMYCFPRRFGYETIEEFQNRFVSMLAQSANRISALPAEGTTVGIGLRVCLFEAGVFIVVNEMRRFIAGKGTHGQDSAVYPNPNPGKGRQDWAVYPNPNPGKGRQDWAVYPNPNPNPCKGRQDWAVYPNPNPGKGRPP